MGPVTMCTKIIRFFIQFHNEGIIIFFVRFNMCEKCAIILKQARIIVI